MEARGELRPLLQSYDRMSVQVVSDAEAGAEAHTKPAPRTLSLPLPMPAPMADSPASSPDEDIDDTVAEIPNWRRWVILFVVSWMPLAGSIWSTATMTATPEISSDYNTSLAAIQTANAGVFCAMAMSALIWLPISTILGRRTAYLIANTVLCACSIGAALAPNLACFTSLWIIGGTTGPFFLASGQTLLADIFEPTVRGTAVGIFLGSCVSANTIAPLLGSIIATFTSWHIIFAVEAGMSALGLVLSFFFIPKASELTSPKILAATPSYGSPRAVLSAFNPLIVFRQFMYPRVLLADLACGLLSFNQYSLMSSVRNVINPRFHLTSPLSSGLFYLAPGSGFIIGSVLGGKLSDITVRKYIRRRNGQRVPEDRLNSSLPAFLFLLPFGTLLYGWSVKQEVGGMALPIVAAFMEGLGLTDSFSGLNTYVAEVRPAHRTAVISGKYVIQFAFAAGSVGGVGRMIDGLGAGWSFTITAIAALIGGIFTLILAKFSSSWKR